MELPDSINQITTEGVADKFAQKPQTNEIDYNEITHLIKRSLSYKESKAFDEGLSYYKSGGSSDHLLIKGMFAMLTEIYSKRIRACSIPQEQQDIATQLIINSFKNCESIISNAINTGTLLNKDKSLIEPSDLVLTMLGFCINLQRAQSSHKKDLI